MPFFHDVQRYRGLEVPFHHRTQRLALDLDVAFGADGLGRFDDLRELVPSSDAVPAHVLRTAGVLDYEPGLGRARYSRVTPGSRVVLVEIVCTAAGPGSTDVRVTYQLTGLSPAGNAAIERFVGPAFVVMIEEWRSLILAALAARAA